MVAYYQTNNLSAFQEARMGSKDFGDDAMDFYFHEQARGILFPPAPGVPEWTLLLFRDSPVQLTFSNMAQALDYTCGFAKATFGQYSRQSIRLPA